MPILIAAAVGAGVGFWAASGTEQISSLVKWAAIGGVAFVAGRALKVI